MNKIEKEALEAKGIKVTIGKLRKARGSKSFSNFKSNSSRMKTYRSFAEPMGFKISSIYNNGPENENDSNRVNASNGGTATNGFKGNQVHSFNQYNNR
jgi:hypothetical protein